MRDLLNRIAGAFGAGKPPRPHNYRVDEDYARLRYLALTAQPSPGMAAGEVWGLVTDLSLGRQGVLTAVAFADGSISLYFSVGGALLGLQGQERIARAARDVLAAAPTFAEVATDPDVGLPLPAPGSARLHFRMGDGSTRAVEFTEAELNSGSHPIKPLYHRVDVFITEIREWHTAHMDQEERG